MSIDDQTSMYPLQLLLSEYAPDVWQAREGLWEEVFEFLVDDHGTMLPPFYREFMGAMGLTRAESVFPSVDFSVTEGAMWDRAQLSPPGFYKIGVEQREMVEGDMYYDLNAPASGGRDCAVVRLVTNHRRQIVWKEDVEASLYELSYVSAFGSLRIAARDFRTALVARSRDVLDVIDCAWQFVRDAGGRSELPSSQRHFCFDSDSWSIRSHLRADGGSAFMEVGVETSHQLRSFVALLRDRFQITQVPYVDPRVDKQR